MELPATKRAYELTLAETLEIPSEDPSHLQGSFVMCRRFGNQKNTPGMTD